MRNNNAVFATAFWRRAYEGLPAGVRDRHLAQIKAAEQWELALDGLIEGWTRAKNAIVRLFQAPSRAH